MLVAIQKYQPRLNITLNQTQAFSFLYFGWTEATIEAESSHAIYEKLPIFHKLTLQITP
jgi:hypothetical protein